METVTTFLKTLNRPQHDWLSGNDGPFCVEYSTVQHCYHISTLPDLLKHNRQAVRGNITNGYLLIGLFPSYAEADQFVREEREKQTNHPHTKGGVNENY